MLERRDNIIERREDKEGDTRIDEELDKALKKSQTAEREALKEIEKAKAEAEKARVEAEKERLEKEQAIETSNTDPLTGLSNRRALEPKFDAMVRDLNHIQDGDQHRQQTQAVLFLYMDLNKFANLNNTLGHDAGDRALMIIAHILKKEEERGGYAARLGGDEFLLVQRMPHNGELPIVISERIRERINKAFIAEGFPTTVAVGLEILRPGDKYNFDEVKKSADNKMYKDKRKPGSGNKKVASDQLEFF